MDLMRYVAFPLNPVHLVAKGTQTYTVCVGVRIHDPLSAEEIYECFKAHESDEDRRAHLEAHPSCVDHLEVTWNADTRTIETCWKNGAFYLVTVEEYTCDNEEIYPDTFLQLMAHATRECAEATYDVWKVLHEFEEEP